MKAISIDWAKLDKPKKREFFDCARRNRRQYYMLIKEWEAKHGPKKDGAKQIAELEKRRKESIVSFLTHGLEFNTAAVFGQNERLAKAEELEKKEEKPENPEDNAVNSDDEDADGDGEITEAHSRKIQEFLEDKEYESKTDQPRSTGLNKQAVEEEEEEVCDPNDVY